MDKQSKQTVFEGYISGYHECFCLIKVTFEEYTEHLKKIPIREIGEKAFWKWDKEHKDLTLYPSLFFPKECAEGKWKFKIIVEAERIK